MRQAQDRVRLFHEAMSKMGGRATLGDYDNPALPSPEECELRARLILEEATEAMVALIGDEPTIRLMVRRSRVIEEMGYPEPNIVNVAQELADIKVVTEGTADVCGIILAPVFNEVMDANDRKCGPGARVRADGKLLKPIDWRGPDIAGVLARQKVAK
jgi:predicted HAD superfamily Cof-like phosphohydrolase